jgi:hypothetical protein
MRDFGRATLVALALLAAAPVSAQPGGGHHAAMAAEVAPAVTRFKCADGGDLTAQFASRDARLIAIVDSGDGPHALATVPWTGGGPVRLTWSDGKRTLTWSPGVQIMWMDGAFHRMCGRGEHRH